MLLISIAKKTNLFALSNLFNNVLITNPGTGLNVVLHKQNKVLDHQGTHLDIIVNKLGLTP